MRNNKGQFVKGYSNYPDTEFKKGEHWRERKPYWEKEWLKHEYEDNFRSASEIANEFRVTEGAILFWLRKHGIKARDMVDIRANKKWGSAGEKNGMYGVSGVNNPHWKGGCTPERQSFYLSDEWKQSCSAVYKRDNASCVKCGSKDKLHVHHIISFANKDKRADVDNLVLLCVKCHRFIHSKKNINREFIREEE